MITQKDFLEKYNISESSFEKAGVEWKQLEDIYNTYENAIAAFEPILSYLVESLRRVPKVHSIKARLKDPEHLVGKIIREKQKDPSLEITTDNYKETITDLIGVRALHLFKADWESIHDWILNSFEIKEKPVINIREGDQAEIVHLFENKGCDVRKHQFGYRSAHYLVVVKPSKKTFLVEIQVRTIFEEGWSEIDHLIRYPYAESSPIVEQYLVMFNRLAGSADEMASYLMYLNAALKSKELKFSKAIEEKAEKNKELQKKIDELEIKIEKIEMRQDDKACLRLGLEQISDITTSMPDFSTLTFAQKMQDFSSLTPKMPDFSNLTPKMPDFSSLTPKMPDFSNLTPKMPDFSNLTPKMPDFSNLTFTPKIPDLSDLTFTPKIPDLSDLTFTPKIPDLSDLTELTTNLHDTSSPIINKDSEETDDQKSSSSDEEDKTDDDKSKKNGEEKNSV